MYPLPFEPPWSPPANRSPHANATPPEVKINAPLSPPALNARLPAPSISSWLSNRSWPRSYRHDDAVQLEGRNPTGRVASGSSKLFDLLDLEKVVVGHNSGEHADFVQRRPVAIDAPVETRELVDSAALRLGGIRAGVSGAVEQS